MNPRLTCGFFVVLGGVKTKDVLSLTGARIDCPQVLAALHFPNRRHYSVFLHCMVSDFFSACFRRSLVCVSAGAFAYCGFILRHTNSKILQSSCSRFLGAANCCISTTPTQRHLNCFPRHNYTPALPLHFYARHTLGGIDENALDLLRRQLWVRLEHASNDRRDNRRGERSPIDKFVMFVDNVLFAKFDSNELA